MLFQKNSGLPLTAICLLLSSTLAHATHGNGSVPVSYNGSLDPVISQTATLTNGYDWFCFAGTPGASASVTVTRTAGALLPNLELWSGTVANGTPYPYTGLTNDAGSNTENDDQSAITVDYILPSSPDGNYSVVVSTYLGETGDYSIALTGGQATTCGSVAPPATAVPTLPQWGMFLLTGLLGLTAMFSLRRRPMI